MEIIFWCEFPEKTNWKLIEKIFSKENFQIELYVACKSRKEFEKYKKKIQKDCPSIKKTNPWPLLNKKQGYWFSGFTDRNSIDKLKEYNKLKIKIDLEPPYPSFDYNFFRFIPYGIRKFFQKDNNSNYLKKTIIGLSKKSKIISNEFPFPEFVANRFGCHMDVRKYKNMIINFIFYSTFLEHFRFTLRIYYKFWASKAVKKYKDKAMFSLGLIGPGIFGNEPVYKKISELRKDIEIIRKAGAKKIAIYSIESLVKRKNPQQWVRLLKNYL